MFYVDAGLQNTRINNRGLSGSSLTDFFRSRMPVDAYNTGRFDFASGPNSVLFGVANSAGSINTSTLQAELRKNHYKFSAQAGRWADYRASVDTNVVLVPQRVALRLLGMHARKESWREWDNREDNRLTGSLRVVPFKKTGTQIVGSFEKANLSGMWSVPQNLADNVSFWETLPDSQRLVDNRSRPRAHRRQPPLHRHQFRRHLRQHRRRRFRRTESLHEHQLLRNRRAV